MLPLACEIPCVATVWPTAAESGFGKRRRVHGCYVTTPGHAAISPSVQLLRLYLRRTRDYVCIHSRCRPTLEEYEEFMAALIDAIDVKRKTLFELEKRPTPAWMQR